MQSVATNKDACMCMHVCHACRNDAPVLPLQQHQGHQSQSSLVVEVDLVSTGLAVSSASGVVVANGQANWDLGLAFLAVSLGALAGMSGMAVLPKVA